MKAHRFRLQSILELRASALEDAKNLLQQALANQAAAQSACDQSRSEENALADQICSAGKIKTASELQSARQAYLAQTRHTQTLRAKFAECQQIVQKCRVQVVKTSRDHEILIKLREKWLKATQYLEARTEENLLNDLMNSQRFQSLRQGEFHQS
jgi:flagellar export protein FliJ